MDINMFFQTQKQNGLPVPPPVMPGAERREAEAILREIFAHPQDRDQPAVR